MLPKNSFYIIRGNIAHVTNVIRVTESEAIPTQLRPYQRQLIDLARDEFRKGKRRVLMVAPCGAGKTVLSAFMCDEHVKRGGHVLYLAHRSELLAQAAATFERTGLGIVSGDAPILHVGSAIDVVSVQTAARRKLPPPTMIVVDECHHIQAHTYQIVLDRYPGACVVGLTATPIRLDGKGLGETFDSMVENVTAEWLIENNYLAPYTYYSIPTVDTSHLKKRMGEYTAGSIDELFSGEKGVVKIAGDVVTHYERLARGQQAICYCPSVEISKQFAAQFNWAGIAAVHLDGTTSAPEREAAIQSFREGRTKIICNVDLLGEGFDVPDCSVTIMLRPTASLGLYIQQAMRCMRYQPDKRALILDHVGNYKRHDAPDAIHRWSLKGQEKRSKYDDVPKTRECPKCYAVVPSTSKKCPECGFDFSEIASPFKVGKTTEVVETELREIEFKKRQRADLKPLDVALREAHSFDDLKQLGRERGYKPGWAYYRAKLRGYI